MESLKNGSQLITFNKAAMNKVLENIENWYPDEHTPHMWIGFEDFPVQLWYEKKDGELGFIGKEFIILDRLRRIWIQKSVRLR